MGAAWEALPQRVSWHVCPGIWAGGLYPSLAFCWHICVLSIPTHTQYGQSGCLERRLKRKHICFCCVLKKNKCDRLAPILVPKREKKTIAKVAGSGKEGRQHIFLLPWKPCCFWPLVEFICIGASRRRRLLLGCCCHGDQQRQERQKTARDNFWIKNRVFLLFTLPYPNSHWFLFFMGCRCSSFDGRREATLYLSHGMVIFTSFTTQQNKYSTFFFLSHTWSKKKKERKRKKKS